MLEDRSYMREDSFGSRRSVTLILIITLVVVWVVQNVIYFYTSLSTRFPFNEYWALSIHGLKEGRFWQLITFQFLHVGPWPWHLLFNCLGLYFFGRSVEETIGPKGFLKLYFLSGFLGGLIQILVTWISPVDRDIPVVGASAGVLGLLTAYAIMFPEREIMFWVLIFPVRLKAKYLLWFVSFLSIYGTLVPFDNVAHAAHLGGIMGGFAYLRWGSLAEKLFVRRRMRPRPRELIKVHLPKSGPWHKGEPEDVPPGEFISREVDPILDKISAHGIQSLTPRERKILEAARAKMERR
jgi:membrane associated rhomboid family serine protease